MDGGMKKMLEKDAKAVKHAATATGQAPLSTDFSQPRSVTLLSTGFRGHVSKYRIVTVRITRASHHAEIKSLLTIVYKTLFLA